VLQLHQALPTCHPSSSPGLWDENLGDGPHSCLVGFNPCGISRLFFSRKSILLCPWRCFCVPGESAAHGRACWSPYFALRPRPAPCHRATDLSQHRVIPGLAGIMLRRANPTDRGHFWLPISPLPLYLPWTWVAGDALVSGMVLGRQARGDPSEQTRSVPLSLAVKRNCTSGHRLQALPEIKYCQQSPDHPSE